MAVLSVICVSGSAQMIFPGPASHNDFLTYEADFSWHSSSAYFAALSSNEVSEMLEGDAYYLLFLSSQQARFAGQKADLSLIQQSVSHARRSFLKQYQDDATLVETLNSGTFNCLSASFFLSDLFGKLGWAHQLMHQPGHVYLIVETEEGKIVVDPTDQEKPVFRPGKLFISWYGDAVKTRLGSEHPQVAGKTREEIFHSTFFADDALTQHELLSLACRNEALRAMESQQFELAVEFAELACSYHQTEENTRLQEEIRFLIALSNPMQVDQDLLLQMDQDALSAERRLEWAALSAEIAEPTEGEFLQLWEGSPEFMQERARKSLEIYGLKWLEEEKYALVLETGACLPNTETEQRELLYRAKMGFALSLEIPGTILQQLSAIAEEFPEYASHSLLLASQRYYLAADAVALFSQEDFRSGKQRILEFLALLPTEEQTNESVLIEWVFGEGANSAFRYGDSALAIDLLDQGLELLPNNPVLLQKLRLFAPATSER